MTNAGILRTNYREGSSNSDTVYPYILVPEAGTAVYPFRRGGEGGASSVVARLAAEIERFVGQGGYEVMLGACLKFVDGGRCYHPDIAVSAAGAGINLRIDIEVDEPYDFDDFVPRHYLEHRSDSQRDRLFVQAGWTVVRFSEKQAALEPANCAAMIADFVNKVSAQAVIAIPADAHRRPVPERKWTRIAAERMAAKGYRETYLGTAEAYTPAVKPPYDAAPLDAAERECAALLPAAEMLRTTSVELPAAYNAEHRHERDANIAFYPETHTYLYKGRDALKSVTTLIAEYFASFDVRATADRKALQTGRDAQSFVDEWGYAGRKASETGSFMHQQFENTFLGADVANTFNFSYTSPTVSRYERIDISKELAMFSAFLRKNDIRPYRTEWNIYDTEKGLAGSPDLLATYKGRLLMFDWKRSTKLVCPTGNSYRINDECWGKYGFGKLSALRDTAYIHYSLQQCIYRHILEKHYGLKLDGMFLVVVHPDYDRYYCIPVADLSAHVNYMMSRL